MSCRICRITVIAAALLTTACEHAQEPAAKAPSSSATTQSTTSPPGMATAAASRGWNDEMGPILVTPSLDVGLPIMFARDTTSGAGVVVELLNHDDHTSLATLHPGAVIRSCAWRRSATLMRSDGRPVPGSWSLALVPGVAVPLGVDGASELLPRDSATLVARIHRLVSAIPEDSASSPFRGLPIVVRDAWLFRLADSTPIAVAIAMRSLGAESNPRAQLIMIIAEPDRSSGDGQWRTAFAERFAGPEDLIEAMDLLAAFELRGSRPAVALVREGDAGLQLRILERVAPGSWVVRWSSLSLPCSPG